MSCTISNGVEKRRQESRGRTGLHGEGGRVGDDFSAFPSQRESAFRETEVVASEHADYVYAVDVSCLTAKG